MERSSSRSGSPAPTPSPKPLTVGELDLAPPGEGELLVRIEAAGLCHSDLSVVDGNRVRPVPMLLGHEAAGVVEQVGAGGSDLAVGQRVVMTFLPRCGHCPACATDGLTPCEPGSAANAAGTLMGGARRLSRDGQPVNHHLGVSGFATHAVVDRTVRRAGGFRRAAGGGLTAGLRGAHRRWRRAECRKPQPGQTVVVVGLGGVGMAAMLTALAHDDVRVVGVDQLTDKLERARALGVHEAYTPDEARERGLKATVVVEAVGHPSHWKPRSA